MGQRCEYPLIIVLGCRTVPERYDDDILPLPAELRCRAAGLLYQQGSTARMIVSGGHAAGVRYSARPFGPLHYPPKCSFEELALACWRKCEAEEFRSFLVIQYAVPAAAILTETMSLTTEENALFTRLLIRRSSFGKIDFSECGIVTNAFHMKRALAVFHKKGLLLRPIYAEDIIAEHLPHLIPIILRYYESAQGLREVALSELNDILVSRSQPQKRTVGELGTMNIWMRLTQT